MPPENVMMINKVTIKEEWSETLVSANVIVFWTMQQASVLIIMIRDVTHVWQLSQHITKTMLYIYIVIVQHWNVLMISYSAV